MESGSEPHATYPPTGSEPHAAYPPTASEPHAAYPSTASEPQAAYPPAAYPPSAYPPAAYPPAAYPPMVFPPQQRRGTIVRGVLTVTVVSAEELVPADIMGKADPYVVLKMKKSEAKSRTRVIYDSLAPVWNQTFDFLVENGLRDELTLELWDHDTFGRDFMGKCVITMERAIAEGEYADGIQLEQAKKGKINVRIRWTPQFVYRNC